MTSSHNRNSRAGKAPRDCVVVQRNRQKGLSAFNRPSNVGNTLPLSGRLLGHPFFGVLVQRPPSLRKLLDTKGLTNILASNSCPSLAPDLHFQLLSNVW